MGKGKGERTMEGQTEEGRGDKVEEQEQRRKKITLVMRGKEEEKRGE